MPWGRVILGLGACALVAGLVTQGVSSADRASAVGRASTVAEAEPSAHPRRLTRAASVTPLAASTDGTAAASRTLVRHRGPVDARPPRVPIVADAGAIIGDTNRPPRTR